MFQILIFAFIIFDILWLVLSDRRLVAIRAPKWTRALNLVFILTMLIGMSIVILLPRALSRELQLYLPWFYIAALFLWHLMIAPLGLVLLWMDNVLTLALQGWRKRPAQSATSSDPAPAPAVQPTPVITGFTRREILSASLIAAPPLLLGATSIAGLAQVGNIRVRKFDIPVVGLHPDLRGLTIAHISDTHYGRFTNKDFTDQLVKTVNNLDADLHLVTGDLIDSSLLDLDHGLAMLRLLNNKAPIYCCVGNHDLFMNKRGFIERVKASEVKLLVDEQEILMVRGQPIQMFGMGWFRTDPEIQNTSTYLFRDKAPGVPSILLAHHPHAFDVAHDAGIDLTLAGHTHGGQVMLTPNFGPGPLMYRYWSGLYQNAASSLVVSNGVGNWFPLRVNAPAEVVHLTLVKA